MSVVGQQQTLGLAHLHSDKTIVLYGGHDAWKANTVLKNSCRVIDLPTEETRTEKKPHDRFSWYAEADSGGNTDGGNGGDSGDGGGGNGG